MGQKVACRVLANLSNSATYFFFKSEADPMLARCSHSNHRILLTAAIFLLVAIAGCASWDSDRLSLDHYRDSRAVEIDHRLEQAAPAVENPF
jgi:hypothetical protein